MAPSKEDLERLKKEHEENVAKALKAQDYARTLEDIMGVVKGEDLSKLPPLSEEETNRYKLLQVKCSAGTLTDLKEGVEWYKLAFRDSYHKGIRNEAYLRELLAQALKGKRGDGLGDLIADAAKAVGAKDAEPPKPDYKPKPRKRKADSAPPPVPPAPTVPPVPTPPVSVPAPVPKPAPAKAPDNLLGALQKYFLNHPKLFDAYAGGVDDEVSGAYEAAYFAYRSLRGNPVDYDSFIKFADVLQEKTCYSSMELVSLACTCMDMRIPGESIETTVCALAGVDSFYEVKDALAKRKSKGGSSA